MVFPKQVHHSGGPMQLSTTELEEYFQSQPDFNPDDVEVQIFYIKRGDSLEDRFAGHIAFPGGKQDSGETLLDAAVRETYEEVGFDLADPTKFTLIGQYPYTVPFFYMEKRRRMLVTPFVFVQLTFEDIKTIYQEREVQSSIWTSIEFLADHDSRFFWQRPQKANRYKTNFTVLMPTILLIDASKFTRDSVYQTPSLVSQQFGTQKLLIF